MNPSKKAKYEVLSDSSSDSDSESTSSGANGGAAKPKGPFNIFDLPEKAFLKDVSNPVIGYIFLNRLPFNLKDSFFDYYNSMDVLISEERDILYAVVNKDGDITQAWSLTFAMESWKHLESQGIDLKHPGPYPWKRSDKLYADLFIKVCEQGSKSWLSSLFLDGFSKNDSLTTRQWVNALLKLKQVAFKSFYRVFWRTLVSQRHLLFPMQPHACVVFRNIEDKSSEWICFARDTNLGPPSGKAPMIYKHIEALNPEQFEIRHKGLFVTQQWTSKFYWDDETSFDVFIAKPNVSPCAMPTHGFCTIANYSTQYKPSVILGTEVYLASGSDHVVKLDPPYVSDSNTLLTSSGMFQELIAGR